MRNIATIVIILYSFCAMAQPAGYKPVQDIDAFRSSLSEANQQLFDISSDFKQEKHLSLLEDKIWSKGKFYFKKDFKVRIEYTEPYSYLMVMNGNKMTVKDEQKSNTFNTGNSKMMQSVNRIIVDCMSGTVFDNPDFKVTAYIGKAGYLLAMVPIASEMKKLFDQIDVYMDKKNLEVQMLTMTEKGGDYTNMNFYNIKHNTSLNESLFKVK